jgi:membrane protease YdiL (CAAX protease family)
MIGMGILIIVAGWLTGGFRSEKLYLWQWVVWLPVWGLVQQYVLQGFINRRAQIIWGRGARSVLLVALLFALLHLPNPLLSVATFLGGVIWAIVYQRAPNLFALALSHALMSLLLATSLPASALNSLRVGIRYFG